jgi:ketosteroid isomerase-like protein
VDDATVAHWLTNYVDAWRTYDVAAIGALFSEDAVYRFHPWDEGDETVRGREAIVSNWLEEPDATGSWTAEYRPWAIDGDRVVAVGTTRYLTEDREAVAREYRNVFLLEFDADSRCKAFTELYMPRPNRG